MIIEHSSQITQQMLENPQLKVNSRGQLQTLSPMQVRLQVTRDALLALSPCGRAIITERQNGLREKLQEILDADTTESTTAGLRPDSSGTELPAAPELAHPGKEEISADPGTASGTGITETGGTTNPGAASETGVSPTLQEAFPENAAADPTTQAAQQALEASMAAAATSGAAVQAALETGDCTGAVAALDSALSMADKAFAETCARFNAAVAAARAAGFATPGEYHPK